MTDRMTAAEFQKQATEKTGTKRVAGAEPVVIDGIRFASKKEARRWKELLLLQTAGKIVDLERQVPIELLGRQSPIMTDSGEAVRRYIADFRYYDIELRTWVIEDAKGHPTEIFNLKKAILAAQGMKITEV